MILRGKLIAESPIYRGNARKTLFTRDGDGRDRLVSLAGEISGTAQSLMDAFIGQSRNGRNIGLLNRLWQRLYATSMPAKLITGAECHLQESSYPQDHYFDLRMGIKLDEDRWAAEANANYKMETLFRNSVFDFDLQIDDNVLRQGDNADKLFYMLKELQEGRFWFGAGKTKGLGRCRLVPAQAGIDMPSSLTRDPSGPPPTVSAQANHLTISLTFDAANPVLVGWNWGKVDPETPAFAAVEGRVLLEGMRGLPEAIRERLKMSIGGPILSAADWNRKLADYLARVTAIWLQEQSMGEVETWTLSEAALTRLGKGKYGLSKKILKRLNPLVDAPFPSQEAAETAVADALADKANMTNRVLKAMEHETHSGYQFNHAAWQEVAAGLGLGPRAAPDSVPGAGGDYADQLAAQIDDEGGLSATLAQACQPILPQLTQQVERQMRLLESDVWVDAEIASRQQHIKIKQMLRDGQITERQWGDMNQTPDAVSAAVWVEFMDAHRRVQYHHMLNERNMRKSITNDENFIAFLRTYRNRTRQELAQAHNIDFRAGPGQRSGGHEVERQYGKPYDTVFMRMLCWAPSGPRAGGAWEAYVPGSTIKGAFRRRASQILKTLWGESQKTDRMLDHLFGAQGRAGRVYFSDAYLIDPQDTERAWCSMDGIRMDPKTGKPAETAKTDYLYAYGERLAFRLRLDLQDIGEDDLAALDLLKHLIQDFQRGDIPLGGEKTNGFGWVEAKVTALHWLTGDGSGGVSRQLFGDQPLTQDGLWHTLHLASEAAAQALQPATALSANSGDQRGAQRAPGSRESSGRGATPPPRASAGFISHRAFGGYCGMLAVEAEVLTPLNIRESGEPSYTVRLDGQPVNGYNFFSMAPPEAASRDDPRAGDPRAGGDRTYALPSKSLKGMLQHVYAIASDSNTPSTDISRLNPADSLFGWVGQGQNQAIMGRVSFSFGIFDAPQLAWFKVPYPYGNWRHSGNQWQNIPGQSPPARGPDVRLIAKQWRLFPHAPLAPIVQQLESFTPDTVQARYVRAILPSSRARFTVRFWNLEEAELQRLLWCLSLEEGLAHKMGNGRYLGFGSLRFQVLPESFLIDWTNRYAGTPGSGGPAQRDPRSPLGAGAEWRLPLNVADWEPGALGARPTSKVIAHHAELRKALNAKQL